MGKKEEMLEYIGTMSEEDIENLASTFERMFRVVDRQLPLDEYSSEELLFCLLMREDWTEAPVKREFYGEHYDTVIGIGKDHTANITLSKQDYEALEDMIYEENTND